MNTAASAPARVTVRLSEPIYLRLKTDPFKNTLLSIREHVPSRSISPPELPLVVLTFHPGYLTGSYDDRDYFERLSPPLFRWAAPQCRLRVFTINHPGYDQPDRSSVDRFHLEPYSIDHQPLAMTAAFSWLFEEQLAQEKEIVWLAYGHSMGGLALGRYDPEPLQTRLQQNGRSLHLTKILSAPAFCLHPQARAAIGRLDLLHTLKQTVGRLPLYAPLATGLYHAFAPLFLRRDGARFSINTLPDYCGFNHVDPFLLLEQGRELIRLEATAVLTPELLANAHIILAQQDGMIDAAATQAFIDDLQRQSCTLTQHTLDSTHLLELDAPGAAAAIITRVIQSALP